MINEKNKFLIVSWLSGLLSAEILISTGECGVQMPPLTAENSHFLRSGSQEASTVMGAFWDICQMHYGIYEIGLLTFYLWLNAFRNVPPYQC